MFRRKWTGRKAAAHLVHHLLGLAVADPETSGLVVCAVWTWDQLSESPWARKPGLQIQLLTGCMIQGSYGHGEDVGLWCDSKQVSFHMRWRSFFNYYLLSCFIKHLIFTLNHKVSICGSNTTTYPTRCWRCDKESPATGRTPLPSRSSRPTSPTTCRHAARRKQTARSTNRTTELYGSAVITLSTLVYVCISLLWPSQTGAPWRCRGCPGRGSPLPVWSRWRSRRSG